MSQTRIDPTLGKYPTDIILARYLRIGLHADRPAYGDRNGQVYWCTTHQLFYVWDSGSWHTVGASVGSGELHHFDYVVDKNYTGTDGDTIILASGSSTIIYKTIQGAINAADATNGRKTILVNSGTYQENVTIPNTLGHDLEIIGISRASTWIAPTSGNAFSVGLAGGTVRLRNLTLDAPAGSYALTTTVAAGCTVECTDVLFRDKVAGDYTGGRFLRCEFNGGFFVDDANFTSHDLAFTDCIFAVTCTWSAGSITEAQFVRCDFIPSSGYAIVNTGTDISSISFVNCKLQSTDGFYHHNGATAYATGLNFVGCTFAAAPTTGVIYFQDHQGSVVGPGYNIVGCTFAKSGTNPYIKCSTLNAKGFNIEGNTFGDLTTVGTFVEDSGGVSITGIFHDSVFGPNIPPDFGVQLDATSANNLYIGTGSVTGASALEAFVSLPQRGTAIPSHSAPEGTFFWDSTNNKFYINNNGTTGWTEIGAGGGGAPIDADYLVGTANGSLTNEIVVGTTPGGELGGTWASPTVDATHSGSAHPNAAPFITFGLDANLSGEYSIKSTDASTLTEDIYFKWSDANNRAFRVYNAGTGSAIVQVIGAAGSSRIDLLVTGDTYPKVRLDTAGIWLGGGGINDVDAKIYWVSANKIGSADLHQFDAGIILAASQTIQSSSGTARIELTDTAGEHVKITGSISLTGDIIGSGGTSIYGGTGANENLTLGGTTSGTHSSSIITMLDNVLSTGYVYFQEIAAPGVAAANTLRAYGIDVAGVTAFGLSNSAQEITIKLADWVDLTDSGDTSLHYHSKHSRVIYGELIDTTQGADRLRFPSFEWTDEGTRTFDKLVIVFYTASTVAHNFEFFKNGASLGTVTVAAAARRGESIVTNFTLTSSDYVSVRHNTNAQNAAESASHVDEGGMIAAYMIEAENAS